jgi:hypothetical protein
MLRLRPLIFGLRLARFSKGGPDRVENGVKWGWYAGYEGSSGS